MNALSSLPPFQDLSLDDEKARALLGPLYDFAGLWTNDPGQGWNLIAVPGPLKFDGDPPFFHSSEGFILETIPYIETISFTPISVTLNRGQFRQPAGFSPTLPQEIQQIGAVLYEQRIESAGVDPSNPHYDVIRQFFEKRGFSKGTPIHAEQGMLLNITNLTDYGLESFQLARMGTIPHGNTMLCLGTAEGLAAPNISPDANNGMPTTVDPTRGLPVEYKATTFPPVAQDYPFYPDFIPTQPNETLIKANKDIDFAWTNHISLSTLRGTGGILSIPFIGGGFDGTRINTTQMTVDYWMSQIKGSGELRLQYVQNINLVFPTKQDPSLPINWPHIGLNTLKRVRMKVEKPIVG